MEKLKNKVAVITGGNSGIGYASAKEFKENGATVIITGRNFEKVEKASNELGVKGIVSNVENIHEINNLVSEISDEYGKIDILLVNAGIFSPEPVGSISEKNYDKQMNINLKGAIFTVDKFVPLLNDNASIINVSSELSNKGVANTAIYSATKAALNSFTKTAATELASRKIRINSINPGPVNTPIYSKTGMSQEQLSEMAQHFANRVPLKRFAETIEIAKLATFLASDDASFITGSEYNIGGGINVSI